MLDKVIYVKNQGELLSIFFNSMKLLLLCFQNFLMQINIKGYHFIFIKHIGLWWQSHK